MTTMATTDPTVAVACWEDIMSRVMTVPEFAEKCVSVLSEQDVATMLKGAKFPMSGVIYGGITANQSADPSRQGMAGELSCTVVVIVQGNAIGNLDQKNEAARLLDLTRKAIRLSISPTGNKWRYGGERPIASTGNAVIYTQRWTTTIMLTS